MLKDFRKIQSSFKSPKITPKELFLKLLCPKSAFQMLTCRNVNKMRTDDLSADRVGLGVTNDVHNPVGRPLYPCHYRYPKISLRTELIEGKKKLSGSLREG